MRIRTACLTGDALNWAVAKCEGEEKDLFVGSDGELLSHSWDMGLHMWWCFDTDWKSSGPIIAREGIAIERMRRLMEWEARIYPPDDTPWVFYSDSPLIAAMRCYVASKLGEEVEVPDELITNLKESSNA